LQHFFFANIQSNTTFIYSKITEIGSLFLYIILQYIFVCLRINKRGILDLYQIVPFQYIQNCLDEF